MHKRGAGKFATAPLRLSITVAVVLSAGPAHAHQEQGVAYGPDHLIAMVAVGLWGAQLGSPAMWMLPITFPMVMALGGMLGMLGVSLPFVESGVAASAVMLGAIVGLRVCPPLWMAALIVGVFAVFHGYAHGAELPAALNPPAYGVGFVVATGLLHLAGIVIGLLVRWPVGEAAVRFLGGGIATLGALFLTSAVGG
jgi:urease accessory protein